MLKQQFPRLVLLLLIILTYFIYAQGFSGALYYDDFSPLGGLAQVKDFHSALFYVFNETSGPLGRPVSMFSFLVNIHDWDQNIAGIFQVNIIIHLVNGLLVYLISQKLFKYIYSETSYSKWLAIVTSFIWLISPLLISTQLIAIQRMASLSAFFVFLGVWGYLTGLEIQQIRLKLGLGFQVFSISVFTLLAVFSKENGILLPVFILVLEYTIIQKYFVYQPWRKIKNYAFFLCLLVIIGYLLSTLSGAEVGYSVRNYTLYERVITQPQILIEYIRLAFIPDIFSYNPFHDNYVKNIQLSGNFYAIFCLLAIFFLLLGALIYREKFAVFSFAILWFLTAHLLESTVIGLELYFEHRNYIAIFSLYFFIIYSLSELAIQHEKFQKMIWGGVVLYLLFLSSITFNVTTLWGKPEEAARAWFINQTGSARASEHLALMWLQQHKIEPSYQILKIQTENCPECLNSQIQYLMLSCILQKNNETQKQLQYVKTLVKTQKFIIGAPSALQALFTQIESKQCQSISINDVKILNQQLIDQTASVGLGRGNHLALNVNLHQIAKVQNNVSLEWQSLNKIWQLSHSYDVGLLIIKNYLHKNELKKAQVFYQNQLCGVKYQKFDFEIKGKCRALKSELKL